MNEKTKKWLKCGFSTMFILVIAVLYVTRIGGEEYTWQENLLRFALRVVLYTAVLMFLGFLRKKEERLKEDDPEIISRYHNHRR
ncbi:MAG: hypothetical protein LBU77_02965 [Clostridiales bacterium]|jgi:hypothetical protein|nr:hypothetical protein [Clostridiales bacterium]